MKLLFAFILITISLIFTGCSNDESEPAKEEAPSSTTKVGSQQVSPPYIGISAGANSTAAMLDTYCWEENCSLTPDPPNELLLGETPLRVKPGEKVEFTFSTGDATAPYEIYTPAVSIVQIETNGEEETDVNGENSSITAPTVEGKYYYNITTEWDGELTGTAIYAFSLLVRKE
ncbi:hypothetical protein [Oceanobacillus manasiensis]|uniref:hypothetical protein n=1 Tax=Oceanobacillus manasiensis TaxID=586413 RepID=UPI0005AA3F63|nr:hypothetical protein [Oceanobacillus manasiensis]